MNKRLTITVDEASYQLAPMNLDEGEAVVELGATKPNEANRQLLVLCLNRADGGQRTIQDVGKLPYAHASKLIRACLELNGLRMATPGESGAAEATA